MFHLYATHWLCWALSKEGEKKTRTFFKNVDPGIHVAKNRAVELSVSDENLRRVITV